MLLPDAAQVQVVGRKAPGAELHLASPCKLTFNWPNKAPHGLPGLCLVSRIQPSYAMKIKAPGWGQCCKGLSEGGKVENRESLGHGTVLSSLCFSSLLQETNSFLA